jgi:hypothetical protein
MKGLVIVLICIQYVLADYPLLVYYTDSTCSTIAGMKGFVDGEAETLYGVTSGSCRDSMVCLQSPDGAACSAITDRNATLSGVITSTGVRENINGVETDLTPDNCTSSDLYSGCYFRWLTVDNTNSDPSILRMSAGSALGATITRPYVAYYSDSGCDTLVAVRGFVNGEPFMLRGVSGATCASAMACLLNPTGDTCQSLNEQNSANVSVVALSDTSFQETENGVTVDRSSSECYTSTVFTGLCHYRLVSINSVNDDPVGTLKPSPSTTDAASTTTGESTTATPSEGALLQIQGVLALVLVMLVSLLA